MTGTPIIPIEDPKEPNDNKQDWIIASCVVVILLILIYVVVKVL